MLCGVFDNGKSTILERFLNDYGTYIRDNKAIPIIAKTYNEKNIVNIMSSLNPFGIDADVRGYVKPTEINCFKLLSSGGMGYISKYDIVKGAEYVAKNKAVIAKALSSSKGKVFGTVQSLGKNEVCTFSYFIAGTFEDNTSSENLVKYLKTKFVRILVLQTSVSINISKKNFEFVPLQNFTNQSDIDWSQSISDIDKQLYKKYNLTAEEIDYIEKTIKPMT